MDEEFSKFMQRMQAFFPGSKDECTKSIEKYGEILETVIVEDIFAPHIVKLLYNNKNDKLLHEVFDYLEEIANNNQLNLIHVCSVTILEILGDDSELLERAKKYMGPQTILLQEQADKALGRTRYNSSAIIRLENFRPAGKEGEVSMAKRDDLYWGYKGVGK